MISYLSIAAEMLVYTIPTGYIFFVNFQAVGNYQRLGKPPNNSASDATGGEKIHCHSDMRFYSTLGIKIYFYTSPEDVLRLRVFAESVYFESWNTFLAVIFYRH